MITGRQIRAARALMEWSADDLAKITGLTRVTISKIESSVVQPQERTLASIVRVFDVYGVEFLENSGVRLRPSGVEVYEGPERFETFTNLVYEQTKAHGGEICLSVTDERLFAKYRKNTTEYYERMQKLYDQGIFTSFRILASKSNFSTKYNYNEYRWQSEKTIAPTAFYTFANHLALISFEHTTPPYVLVVQSAPLAEAYRRTFDIAWAAAKPPPKPKFADQS